MARTASRIPFGGLALRVAPRRCRQAVLDSAETTALNKRHRAMLRKEVLGGTSFSESEQPEQSNSATINR